MATAPFSISAELDIIKCNNPACGHMFALIGYFNNPEYEDPHNWMYQADAYYCPYCGIKRLERGAVKAYEQGSRAQDP